MTHTDEPVRRRSDGERSRALILDAAARLATLEGLEGLSIGRLAQAIGMSKSGLYAHFGSKEELQLATVAAAEEVFDAEVIEPALRAEDGLDRVERALRALPISRRAGRVPRRLLLRVRRRRARHPAGPGARPGRRGPVPAGRELVASGLGAAQSRGELDPDASVEQLTFEINAILAQANTVFLLYGDRKVFDLARRALRDRGVSAGRTGRGS